MSAPTCDICHRPVAQPEGAGRPRKRHEQCRKEANRRHQAEVRGRTVTQDELAAKARRLELQLRHVRELLEGR